MNLFIPEPNLEFELDKVATPISDNQDEWAQSILRELSKQAPYAMEYAPKVDILHQDEQSGTALGSITLTSSTQSALATDKPSAAAPARALIPLIIKNHDMSPLDLLMTKSGKIYPLTEPRLREALFRPETFELVSKDQGDKSIRDIFGIGGGAGVGTQNTSVIEGTGMKYSSEEVDYPLLRKIADSALKPDLNEISQEIAQNPGVLKQATKNPKFLGALQVLSGIEKTARADTLDLYRAVGQITPTHVMQFGTNSDGAYWAKSASRDYYSPVKIDLNRRELIKMASEEVAVKVDKEGTVTVSERGLDKLAFDADLEWEQIEDPGVYRVRTTDGRELTGWVIPKLRDIDGNSLPLAVFTNGSESAVQDQIVGARLSRSRDIPSSEPKGTGVFMSTDRGRMTATEPVAVIGTEGFRGGTRYLVRTFSGEDRKVTIIPGVQKVVATGGSEVFLPDTTKFLSVDKEAAVSLVETAGGLNKTSAHTEQNEIIVYGDGDYFSIRQSGVPKLASTIPNRVSYDDAVFVLCSAGCGADEAHEILKEASYGRGVPVAGVRDVRLASEESAESRAKVASVSRDIRALRRNLVKEASVLVDATTVDASLGLQFINSENVRVYISHIPYFDKCVNILCELLMASRLGISEIPEYAASRAARSVDEVVQGLRALALRKVNETAN